MADFPTLSLNPFYPLDEEREDSVIRSASEGGYDQTRQRYTRIRRSWTLRYRNLTSADKSALDTFIDSTVKGGADSFNWTHPVTAMVHVVRFGKPPKLTYNDYNLYEAEMTLKEV